ncbi:hypothetical protein OIU85_001117 [Salix viminalis]|uniref:Bulb-type lectin domain-containing protein n=1 Tax=Salix viminalis TaxID=40686 RepID=A0A9Q0VKU5_SALVM|nr:hypothetical protein OIU85_001117 [Salix viminalis]
MAYPCFRTTLNLLLFLVLTLSVFAQTPNVNVTLGSHLIASDSSVPWKSPSGDFAFGFHKINGQKLFLLGIWFDGIPEKTLVWYANGDHLAPEGSKVELTLDGSFRLTSPQGEEIWKPRSSVDGVAYAALLNNGNFILTDNSSKSLWESFKDPRDTMLPTQILEVDGKLSSRLQESNYSKGRFLLRLQPNDGSIVLKTIALPTDYEYGTYFTRNTSDEASPNSSGYQLVLDKSGHLNVLLDSRSVVNLTMGREFPAGDYFYRATLDADGLFTLYGHPRAQINGRWGQTWFTIWSVPDDICSDSKGDLGLGPCGYNSYCSLGTNRRPLCECLPGFSLSDTNNKFGGCQQNSLPNCREGKSKPEDLYAIQEVPNTFWPTSSNYEQLPSLNEDECRQLCLSDCNCVVAVIKEGFCWKKKLPLSNGRKDYNTFGKALVKVSNSAVSSDEPSRPKSDTGNKNQTTSVLAGAILLEWFRNMPITAKVDVYSYGVMLLEIICCRKCLDMENENEEEIILADWAYDCYKRRKLGKLVETDEEAKNDMKKLERLVMVSIWCMQEDPSLRPSMWTVTQMLEGIIQVSAPPCPSPFSSIS